MAGTTTRKTKQTQDARPVSAPNPLANGKRLPLIEDAANNPKFQQARELLGRSFYDFSVVAAVRSFMEESPEVIPYIACLLDAPSGIHGNARSALGIAARNEKTRDAAFAALCTALHDENQSIRWFAGCTFIDITRTSPAHPVSTDISKAMPDIAHAMNDSNESVRWTMASTLANAAKNKQRISAAIPGLAKMLSDPHGEAAQYAVYALSSAAGNGEDVSITLPVLEKMLHAYHFGKRTYGPTANQIAIAIGGATMNEKTRDAALGILLKCLTSEDEKIKGAAISGFQYVLSSKHSNIAFEKLIMLLKDENPMVRAAAANCLGAAAEFNGADIFPAIPALAVALYDGGVGVRVAAAYAISKAAVNGTDISIAIPALSDAFCSERPEDRRVPLAGMTGWALQQAATKGSDPLIVLKGLIEPSKACPDDGHILDGLLGIAKRMQTMDDQSRERMAPEIVDLLGTTIKSLTAKQGAEVIPAICRLIKILACLPDNLQAEPMRAIRASVQNVLEYIKAQPDATILSTAGSLIALLEHLPNGLLRVRTMRVITVKVRNILYSQEFLHGANKNSPEYAKTCRSCAEVMNALKAADARLEARA